MKTTQKKKANKKQHPKTQLQRGINLLDPPTLLANPTPQIRENRNPIPKKLMNTHKKAIAGGELNLKVVEVPLLSNDPINSPRQGPQIA